MLRRFWETLSANQLDRTAIYSFSSHLRSIRLSIGEIFTKRFNEKAVKLEMSISQSDDGR